jgi:putative ABC transport system permease protein
MLSPFDLLLLTRKSLLGNPLRSGLTTLGVFMGVFAVSATLQVGDISRVMIEKQLAEREAPQVEFGVYASKGRQPKTADLSYLRQRLRHWQTISANGYVPSDNVSFQGEEADPMVTNVTEEYLATSGRKVLQGRFLSAVDFSNYRSVVVIDRFLADQLFKGKNPVGERIFLMGRLWSVVGVIESKILYTGAEPKGLVLIPVSTYSSLSGSESIYQISVRPKRLQDIEAIKTQGEQLIKQRFPDAQLWSSTNVEEILAQQQIWTLASQGLTAVGIISLLIGGIGITNITVAAVVERTAEIGLRRAIGATRLEILLQFVLEAFLLSLIGGGSAVALVHGITTGISSQFSLPYQFNPRTAGLALGSAIGVGVGACFLPALRASRLDPVKALREG